MSRHESRFLLLFELGNRESLDAEVTGEAGTDAGLQMNAYELVL